MFSKPKEKKKPWALTATVKLWFYICFFHCHTVFFLIVTWESVSGAHKVFVHYSFSTKLLTLNKNRSSKGKIVLLFSFVVFRVNTQGLMHAKQALYNRAVSPSLTTSSNTFYKPNIFSWKIGMAALVTIFFSWNEENKQSKLRYSQPQ